MCVFSQCSGYCSIRISRTDLNTINYKSDFEIKIINVFLTQFKYDLHVLLLKIRGAQECERCQQTLSSCCLRQQAKWVHFAASAVACSAYIIEADQWHPACAYRPSLFPRTLTLYSLACLPGSDDWQLMFAARTALRKKRLSQTRNCTRPRAFKGCVHFIIRLLKLKEIKKKIW